MLRFGLTKTKISHEHPTARLFAHLAFIQTLGVAAFAAMFPLILEERLGGPNNVGFYYSVISFICIGASLISTAIFKKYSKVTIARIVLIGATVMVFLMNFASSVWNLGVLDLARAICVMFGYISLVLFNHEYNKGKAEHEAEGRYYFYFNMGWLLGPLVGGWVASMWGKEAIFNLVASCFLACLCYFELHIMKSPAKVPHSATNVESVRELGKAVRDYFKQKSLRKVFWVSFGFNFWYCVRAIYLPLTMLTYGFSPEKIGLFMAMGILPYVLIEKYIVRRAATGGVRTYIVAGFWYLACFVSLFYFLRDFPAYVSVVFVLANIGAAMIEPLKEMYFFEVVKKSEAARFWGIYNIADYGAYLVAPLVASFFLSSVGDVRLLWAFIALCIIGFSLGSLTIEKKLKK